MQPNLTMVLEQVGKDKGIDAKILLQPVEQAILTAAKKVFGLHRELEAQFNEEIGAVDLFQICYVVEGPEAAAGREITKEAAEKHGLEAEIGDELLFQIFYRTEDIDRAAEQEQKIYEKIVRIESSAREPGARAKIAVSSRDRDVDPVGACVGMKGSRVQAVVQELRGEKIDIVPYSEDPARFVCNAIAPAEVSRVGIDAETHTMELIVPDDKLSLAIGKKGQNVRLASQLTGWRIDIHSESKVRELEEQSKRSMAEIEGSSEELANTLFRLGWHSADEVAKGRIEELGGVPGVGGEAGAAKVIAAAARAAEIERKQYAEEMARVQAEHDAAAN